MKSELMLGKSIPDKPQECLKDVFRNGIFCLSFEVKQLFLFPANRSKSSMLNSNHAFKLTPLIIN